MTGLKTLPWKRIHFTGIGGVGMAGLAHIVADFGVSVSGTDAVTSGMLESLAMRGLDVCVGHDASAVDGADLLVYSNAIPEGNCERVAASRLGIPTCLRGEFLARLAPYFEQVIAVAGSHGKTTTTAMIAHVLREAGHDPGYLVGGEVRGWPRSACAGGGRILVTEVDESDGTQALLSSDVAVVTNIEDDHCWSVGGIEALEACFAEFANRASRVVAWRTPSTERILGGHASVDFVSSEAIPGGVVVGIPGAFNLFNGALAVSACQCLGVSPDSGWGFLGTFPGVGRRLTDHGCFECGRVRIVEDYAHHPTELSSALAAIRGLCRGSKLVVLFQPHRFERVKRYSEAFSRALSGCDRVWVIGAFAAWRDNGEGVESAEIARGIGAERATTFSGDWDSLASDVVRAVSGMSGEVMIAVIGAGDIHDAIAPLKRAFWRSSGDAFAVKAGDSCGSRRIFRDQSWSELTTLRIGSGCPLLARPETEDDLADVLRAAWEEGMPVRVLGAGSNLVGADDAVPDVWVQLVRGRFLRVDVGEDEVFVGGGVCLFPVIRRLSELGRVAPGMGALSWIPGTLGGAVRMNAGAGGVSVGEYVARLFGMHCDGTVWEKAGSDIHWSYRQSSVPEDVIVTGALLRTGSVSPADAAEATEEAGKMRAASQPRGRSAGCIFRNPPGESAGRLIDASGCKGMRIGRAFVSAKHANFLMTDSEGTCSESDFVDLVLSVQRRVFEKTGTVLEVEVEAVGSVSRERMRRQAAILAYERERRTGGE